MVLTLIAAMALGQSQVDWSSGFKMRPAAPKAPAATATAPAATKGCSCPPLDVEAVACRCARVAPATAVDPIAGAGKPIAAPAPPPAIQAPAPAPVAAPAYYQAPYYIQAPAACAGGRCYAPARPGFFGRLFGR